MVLYCVQDPIRGFPFNNPVTFILNPTKDPSDRLAETCSGRKPRTAIIDLKSHEFFQGMILIIRYRCVYNIMDAITVEKS